MFPASIPEPVSKADRGVSPKQDSPWEGCPLGGKAAGKAPGKDVFFCVQAGASMYPALREGDIMEIEPPGRGTPGPGDVICFRSRGGFGPVVHRIDRRSSGGFRTRGDGSRSADPWLLHPDDIHGRVIAAWRGRKRLRIRGGRRGRIASRWIRQKSRVERFLLRMLRPLYHKVALSDFIRRLCPGRFCPRVVLFEADGRRRFRLMLGRYQLGHYDARRGRWLVRRPFLLVAGGHIPERDGVQH